HDSRPTRSSITRLVLHSVPVEWIVARRDHYSTGCPEVLHAERERRRGRVIIRQSNIDARSREHFGDSLRKQPRSESGVIANHDSTTAIFILQNVVGDG